MVRTPTSCPPHAHTPPAPPSDITLAELGFGVAAAAAEPGSGATAAAEPGSGVAVEPGSGSGSGAAVEHRVKSPYIIRMSRVVRNKNPNNIRSLTVADLPTPMSTNTELEWFHSMIPFYGRGPDKIFVGTGKGQKMNMATWSKFALDWNVRLSRLIIEGDLVDVGFKNGKFLHDFDEKLVMTHLKCRSHFVPTVVSPVLQVGEVDVVGVEEATELPSTMALDVHAGDEAVVGASSMMAAQQEAGPSSSSRPAVNNNWLGVIHVGVNKHGGGRGVGGRASAGGRGGPGKGKTCTACSFLSGKCGGQPVPLSGGHANTCPYCAGCFKAKIEQKAARSQAEWCELFTHIQKNVCKYNGRHP